MIAIEELEAFIQRRLEGAEVRVSDMTGRGDHFEIEVVSRRFQGMSLLERHRLLHDIVQEAPDARDIHAVKFKTLTPQERSGRISSS